VSELEDVDQPRNRAERRAAARGRRRRAAGAALTAGSAALAATAAIAGPGALPAGAVAQTFTVSSTDDAGPGTLRQAVLDANANPGDDTIVFTGLARFNLITLTTGQLTVTDNVDIQGMGGTVWGGDTTRVFYLAAPDQVSISGLTIAHGNTGGPGGAIVSIGGDLVLDGMNLANNVAAGDGGAIDFSGAGAALTIRNSRLSGNTTEGEGGGLHADGAGQVTIESSGFVSNVAAADGGGLDLSELDGVSVTGTSISDNHAGGGGGALYADDIAGAISLNGVKLATNDAGSGGGGAAWFDVDDAVTLSNSTVSGNHGSHGGGLYFDGDHGAPTTIEFTTISGNVADDGDGGGFYAEEFTGALVVRNSTISGNATSDDGGGFQLVNFYEGASASILNSTITGNTAAENGGAGAAYYVAALDIVQSTITGNTADFVGGLYLYGEVNPDAAAKAAQGGDHGGNDGVESDRQVHGNAVGDGNNNIVGTILAGNTGIDLGPVGAVTSDHSILGLIDPAVVVTDAGGTQLGVDPLLGALAANGGPTQTMALLPGSPAKDAGPDPEPTFPGSEFDQRGDGFARVVDGRADVGAFEVQATQPAPPPVVIPPKFTG
jgi:hypothetical protein